MTKLSRHRRLSMGSAILLLLACNGTLQAHHSFSAEFLADQVGVVSGTVTEVWFRNPHIRLYVDAAASGNSTVQWDVRGKSPSVLARKGWKRNTVQPGDAVTIVGYLGRDGRRLMQVIAVMLDDGTLLKDRELPSHYDLTVDVGDDRRMQAERLLDRLSISTDDLVGNLGS